MILKQLSLANETATQAIGETLAPHLRRGDVVCLTGPLGAGKSTFARALIQTYLRDREMDVPSPTFTLVERYAPAQKNGPAIWHFDLYRLNHVRDVRELGLAEAMEQGICLIEWAERIAELLPPDCLVLSLKPNAENDAPHSPRLLTIGGNEDWSKRLADVNL